MYNRRENIIRDPDTFLIEQTNKSKLNTFTQQAEWADNDHLSQLPEDVLREIFAFLNRFDLSIVRRVNQTLHDSIGKCWSKLAKNRADKLTVYQYNPGFAFKLEQTGASNYAYMMERVATHYEQNSEEKKIDEFDEGSLYELRYEETNPLQDRAKPGWNYDYYHLDSNHRFINVPIFFNRLEELLELHAFGDLVIEGICIDKDVLCRLEALCADSTPISMLSLKNVYITEEISNDSMLSFISTLKPCSIEIDVARIHHPIDLSSERFLEAFANDPNVKYSFEVDFVEADYELQDTPSKGFLERILPRFTNFRLQYIIVNVDRLFDLISIGLTLCEKMSWAFAVEEIYRYFYLVEPRFEDRAREAGFEHRKTTWAHAVQRAGEEWSAYVYYEDDDDIVIIIFSNEDRE